jgi:DNA-binding transcriptional regulator PaaX
MTRGVSKKSNLTKDTLLTIAAAGVIVIAAGTSPYFLHTLAKSFFREQAKKHRRARARKLRELEKRKLISFKELGGGKIRIELTHRGKNLIRQYDLDDMQLKKSEKWDQAWRVMMYDIPVHKKKAAGALRNKIKQLGLYQLQKSVWVSPYEYHSELEFICSIFEINMSRYIYYFRTKEIPKEKECKRFFDLK